MPKHHFHFDKATGTMIPSTPAVEQAVKHNVHQSITERKADDNVEKPMFHENKQIVERSKGANVQEQIVKMQRVTRQTPIQLVDENGKPEAYLDSITTGIMMFREKRDYDICQITDQRGHVLAYIGGYALGINFNMNELNSLAKIEQCLEGIKKLFRQKIMSQTIQYRKTES